MQLRYLGVAPEMEPLLRDELPRVLGGLHGSMGLSWDSGRTFGVAVNGDAHHEQEGNLDEVTAALDLHFPRLFGEGGGLWLGAAVGEGWMASRSAYGAGDFERILDSLARTRRRGYHALHPTRADRSPSPSWAAHCSWKGG